jgi:hypothetical protein
MARAMLTLARDAPLRRQMGNAARVHIRAVADPEASLHRIERVLDAVLRGPENPFAAEDLKRSEATADYLDQHQFGHSFREQIALRPRHYRVRFHQWRKRWLAPAGRSP